MSDISFEMPNLPMMSIGMFHTVECQLCHQFCFKPLLAIVVICNVSKSFIWMVTIHLSAIPMCHIINRYYSYNWWHQNIFFIHLFVANFVIEVVLKSVYLWHHGLHFKRLYDNDIIVLVLNDCLQMSLVWFLKSIFQWHLFCFKNCIPIPLFVAFQKDCKPII